MPIYTPRQLAEHIRDVIATPPSDLLPGQPVGTLNVERSWIPLFRLEEQAAIVVTVLSADDSGSTLDRRMKRDVEIDIDFSVQQLLPEGVNPISAAGKAAIDAIVDYSEGLLRSVYVPLTDSSGLKYMPLRYERTIVDDALIDWHQVSVLFSITYKTYVP